uniref:Uncharacterized protein n=1 Tax=Manihot esculenta TaxID=3983 RepID=A0A2C9VV96_MANES
MEIAKSEISVVFSFQASAFRDALLNPALLTATP